MNGSPSKFTVINWLYSCTFIGCIAQNKNVVPYGYLDGQNEDRCFCVEEEELRHFS
jgi:hypothetical protein